MPTRYTNRGDVRGDCGHMHRTPEAAGRCAHLDSVYCKRHGGYSDYTLVTVENGREIVTSREDFDSWDFAKYNSENC